MLTSHARLLTHVTLDMHCRGEAGQTLAGPPCKILDELREDFYLIPHVTEPKFTAALATLRLYDAAEPGRLVAPFEEAIKQPALRESVEKLSLWRS